VRIYEVQQNGSTVGKAMFGHDAPVLCCAWSKDGTKLASGGADKLARLYDLQSGQSQPIAQHDAPIRSMRWVDTPGQPILATGGWDKTLKYWDCRQQNPVATTQLPERCYAMDVCSQLLVVACADRHVAVYNLSNPTTPFKTLQSPLKWQTRSVACFTTGNGYALGSIEGRVAIQYVEDKDVANNFSFKCHRDNSQVYAVNAITFHPVFGTFSTAGSDGTYNFWDKDSKQRLKMFTSVGSPIVSTAFNRNGTIFAYAVCYDWSKGYQHAPSPPKSQIFLYPVKEEDVKQRPPKKR
jgi:mRNA export factor